LLIVAAAEVALCAASVVARWRGGEQVAWTRITLGRHSFFGRMVDGSDLRLLVTCLQGQRGDPPYQLEVHGPRRITIGEELDRFAWSRAVDVGRVRSRDLWLMCRAGERSRDACVFVSESGRVDQVDQAVREGLAALPVSWIALALAGLAAAAWLCRSAVRDHAGGTLAFALLVAVYAGSPLLAGAFWLR
jgi:hypothetical protein